MTKPELINELASKTDVSKKDCANVIDAFQDIVKEILIKGDKLQLVGFGTFEVAERAERKGRNPKTGEAITIPATKSPKFKPSRTLKEAVNAQVSECMKRLEFNTMPVSELLEVMVSTFDLYNDGFEYPVITAYGKYDVIKELLEGFLADGFEISGDICLETPDATGYDKEFALYLTEDGVSVCKIFENGKYLNEYPDVAFVHEDCNSKMLKNIESKLIFEFVFDGEHGDDEDEFDNDDLCCDDCDCYECDNRIRSKDIKCNETVADKLVEYSKDDNGDLHGFSVSKGDGDSYMSYSLYTSDKLSLRDIQSLMQEKGF